MLEFLGLLAVLRFAFYVAEFVYRRFIQPPTAPNSYGKWSIITGSTDGIGKALAFNLAAKGQNLILISRTQSKLDATKAEIEAAAGPKVQVKTLAVDFSDFTSGTKIYESVKSLLEGHKDDLGVLYNNVGLSYDFPRFFHEISDESAQNLITVNVNSCVLMTRLFLASVLNKKPNADNSPKAAVVNIGSSAGVRPLPLLTEYSAAKSFVETFTDCLAVEYKSKNVPGSAGGPIDFQCHVPMMIVSKMSKVRRASLFVPSAETYASYIVSNLGKGVLVSGHLWHALAADFSSLMPKSVYMAIGKTFQEPMRSKGLRKLTRETKTD